MNKKSTHTQFERCIVYCVQSKQNHTKRDEVTKRVRTSFIGEGKDERSVGKLKVAIILSVCVFSKPFPFCLVHIIIFILFFNSFKSKHI